MPWDVAKRALDLVLASDGKPRRVGFSGGEPLLEPKLLRRCVEYVRSHPAGREVELAVTTNGTLLTPKLIEFLIAHDVELEISCDGVPEAQAARGAWTYAVLDKLLDDLVHTDPAFVGRRVHLGITLTSGNVGFLAASVGFLMTKGVAAIHVTPCVTRDDCWDSSSENILHKQATLIIDHSLNHWVDTGAAPVSFLAGVIGPGSGETAGFPCNACTGQLLCVDPDGCPWTCPALSGSTRTLPPLAEEAARALDLGRRIDAQLPKRLQRLPKRASTGAAFVSTADRRAPAGPCGNCEHLAACHVCPAALEAPALPTDSPLVPALHCAFNRITIEARGRFLEQLRGPALRRRLEGLTRQKSES